MTTSRQWAHIASIPRNQREDLRITLEHYEGFGLISQGIWYDHDAHEMRPGEQGVMVQLRRISELTEALKAAKLHAEQLGLVEAE